MLPALIFACYFAAMAGFLAWICSTGRPPRDGSQDEPPGDLPGTGPRQDPDGTGGMLIAA